MTGQFDLSSEPKRRSFQDTLAIKRPQIAYRQHVSNVTTMLGMAIGYLLLVAMLTLAPVLSQALTSSETTSLACTDPGGSR